MWEVDVGNQITSFFLSIVLGALFGLFYDFLRAIYRTSKIKKWAMCILDILFFFICGLATFMFLLAVCCGEMRAYILCGICIGAISFRYTLSVIWLRVLVFVFKHIKQGYVFLNRQLFRFITFMGTKTANFVGISGEFIKKNAKQVKKLLKRLYGLVYNQKRTKLKSN